MDFTVGANVGHIGQNGTNLGFINISFLFICPAEPNVLKINLKKSNFAKYLEDNRMKNQYLFNLELG